MEGRPLTTLMIVGIILFLAWLWRNGKLPGFLGTLTRPAEATPPVVGGWKGVPHRAPTGGRQGPLGGVLQRAPDPTIPADKVDDYGLVPYPDGGVGEPRGPLKPGEWRPKWLTPYPNRLLQEMLN